VIGRESKAKMKATALAVIALDQLNSVSTGSKKARSYQCAVHYQYHNPSRGNYYPAIK
jgi:hypothetical protein